jgi:hypothetical protein
MWGFIFKIGEIERESDRREGESEREGEREPVRRDYGETSMRRPVSNDRMMPSASCSAR